MKTTLTQRLAKFATYTILVLGAAFILLPFLWMISTSLKPDNEVLLMPPKWIPSALQWKTMWMRSRQFLSLLI